MVEQRSSGVCLCMQHIFLYRYQMDYFVKLVVYAWMYLNTKKKKFLFWFFKGRFINKRALTDFALCHRWNYWNDPCCRSNLACFRDRIRDRIRDRRQDDNDLADWTYLWCWIQKEKLNCTTTFNWTVDSIEQILLFWVFEMSFDKYWVVFLSIKIILKRIRFYMFYE